MVLFPCRFRSLLDSVSETLLQGYSVCLNMS